MSNLSLCDVPLRRTPKCLLGGEMSSQPSVVLMGATISILGNVPYIRNTLRGVTKPNRVSWLLWSIAPLIGVAAALSDGVSWPLLPVFMAGFCPFLIFCSSFINKRAYWKLGRFDYGCALFATLALAYWAYTRFWSYANQPAKVVGLAIAADACAALPVLRKAWYEPHTETASIFATAAISAGTGFFAIEEWKFTEWAFPAYLAALGTGLWLTILVRKRLLPVAAISQ